MYKWQNDQKNTSVIMKQGNDNLGMIKKAYEGCETSNV